MNESELTAMGFMLVAGDDVLHAPPNSDVTLTPISRGEFFELRIRLGGIGLTVVAVLSKTAIKQDQG
jgi:hypothetical protein